MCGGKIRNAFVGFPWTPQHRDQPGGLPGGQNENNDAQGDANIGGALGLREKKKPRWPRIKN